MKLASLTSYLMPKSANQSFGPSSCNSLSHLGGGNRRSDILKLTQKKLDNNASKPNNKPWSRLQLHTSLEVYGRLVAKPGKT